METGGFSVTKVKTFRGHDGTGYNATLMLNGKPVALVVSLADGGEMRFDWIGWPSELAKTNVDILNKHIASLGNMPENPELGYKALPWNADCFVEELVNMAVEAKKVAALTKKGKTVFRAEKQRVGEYYTVNIPPTEENKTKIRAKYGSITFLN